MANIKNFGLVGVAADVQFGKAGPRLINDTNVFTFKNAAGSAAAPINAGVATVSGLTVGATGVVSMGANKVTNVAAGVADTDAVNFKQMSDALNVAGADVAALQTEINKIEASVGLAANGDVISFTSEAAAGAFTFKEAIERVDQARAVDALLRQTMDAQIQEEFAAADAILATKIQTAIAGISWKNPVKQMVADATARDAVTGVVAGDRVYVAADHKVYTYVSSSYDAGVSMTTGDAFFDKSSTVPYVFNGTSMVQFNGAAGLTGGLGLVLTGNNLDLDLATNGGLRFYPDGDNPNNTVGLRLDGASLEVGASGLKVGQATLDLISATSSAVAAEATRAGIAEAAIQAELDATQIAAGLSTAGAYVAETTAHYINDATSLKGADLLLDGAIKTVADALAALGSGSITALQTEVNFVEAAVGLDADGKFVTFADTNYLNAATSIVSSISALDVALKAVDVAYKAADLVLQGNIDAEVTRAKAVEAVHDNSITGLVDGLQAEIDRAIAAEQALEDDVTAIVAAADAEVTRAKAAEAQTLVDAKAYAKGLDDAMLVYVDGKVTLLQAAIATAVGTAAADATSKANQALVDAKAYADTLVSAGVQNAARAIYMAFDATQGSEVTIGVIAGFVHRIKVYVTAAATTDSSVEIGVTDAHSELASTGDIDSSTVGLYNLEVNHVYATATELKVFMANGAKGTVVIEYLA